MTSAAFRLSKQRKNFTEQNPDVQRIVLGNMNIKLYSETDNFHKLVS